VSLVPELGRPLQAINVALPTTRATEQFRAELVLRLRESAGY
jgi:hypothetical protein